jgi:DNA-binding SARP family transcriptional activator/tetratricopeptide (TPR) repeat protein
MYTLRLLGPPFLSGPTGPVSGRVTQERKLAFLAVLALTEGRTLTRDSLAALFWPESDQARARHNVADTVWVIRSSLGKDAILAQGKRLTLNPEVVATDVEAFEATLRSDELARAVELHAGPFMEGFHISGAPEFEHWLSRERRRLASAHADALEELVRGALEAGRGSDAAGWARRLFAVDALNTSRALLCMEALAASGDVAGAIRAGVAHEGELEKDLGLPVPPEVKERIRELRASPPPVPAVRARSPVEAPSGSPEGASGSTVGSRSVPPPERAIPAGPAPRSGPTRWRRPTSLLTVAAVAVVFLAWIVPGFTGGGTPDLVPDRIVVAAFENRTGDPELDLLGRLAADVLIRGLTGAAVGEVVLPGEMIGTGVSTDDGPRGPRQAQTLARELLAGISVSGTIDSGPEGTVLATTVTMSPGSRVAFVLEPEPVDPTDPGPALERVRSRVVGTVTAHLGQKLPEHPFVVPTPSYESYRTADRATARFLEVRYEEAAELYGRAYELDATAIGYLLWEGVSRHNLSDRRSVEAILDEVRPRRDELTPFDDAQFEWLEARHLGDLRRALRATRTARAIHPHSGVGGFQLARELLRTGHPGEALEVLLELDPYQGWLSRHLFYWTHVAGAYRLLGRHEEELAAAEEGYRQHRSSGLLTARLRALAALGRTPELRRTLRESTNPPFHALEAARALHRHGYPEDGVAVAEEGLRALASAPRPSGASASEVATRRSREARLLILAGRLTEARDVLLELLDESPSDRDFLGWAGFVEARLGLEAEARGRIEVLESLGSQPFTYGGHKVARAAIHAELGDDPALIRLLLEESHREGWPLDYFHFTILFDPVREHPDVRDFFELPRGR